MRRLLIPCALISLFAACATEDPIEPPQEVSPDCEITFACSDEHRRVSLYACTPDREPFVSCSYAAPPQRLSCVEHACDVDVEDVMGIWMDSIAAEDYCGWTGPRCLEWFPDLVVDE